MIIHWYYNLDPTPIPDKSGFIEVERIYCFDWDRFQKQNWQDLTSIYSTLPGALSENEQSWFGDNESQPPFLWASVEPPGLQVYGVLPLSDWQKWDREFLARIGPLPMRDISAGD